MILQCHGLDNGQCDRNSLVLGKQENVTETAWIMLLGKRKIIMLPKEV